MNKIMNFSELTKIFRTLVDGDYGSVTQVEDAIFDLFNFIEDDLQCILNFNIADKLDRFTYITNHMLAANLPMSAIVFTLLTEAELLDV